MGDIKSRLKVTKISKACSPDSHSYIFYSLAVIFNRYILVAGGLDLQETFDPNDSDCFNLTPQANSFDT